jgi:GNAT superfamily N-acetyltransferase
VSGVVVSNRSRWRISKVVSEAEENKERVNGSQIGLKDVLAVVDMAMGEQSAVSDFSSLEEIFKELRVLIDQTVHATKIKRFSPGEGSRPFHTFEILSDGGEVLGHLNMIYLRKPITSYYLVYVEVLPHFRGKGLGAKILSTFGKFVEASRTIGLLDNIILPEEPTYTLYAKHGWRPIEDFIGHETVAESSHYMVYIPESIKVTALKEKLTKLLFSVKKKRPVIDMQDNEAMVRRTIEEFRNVYTALNQLFEKELQAGTSSAFMCYMLTKFVTNILGFRRRIATFLGYTGGESLDQISISDQIKDLPILPYSIWSPTKSRIEIWEETEAIRHLPERLMKEPTFFIEDLPLYRRPYLSPWIEQKGIDRAFRLKISDLMELGFDPTRLREFRHQEKDYIFERISPSLFPSIEKRRSLLKKVSEPISRVRLCHAAILINPPLAVFLDRGNGYILREKVGGIHSEEALDQLRSSPHLKEMNRAAGIDRTLVATINEVDAWMRKSLGPRASREVDDLTFFVPWDFEMNMPKVTVDVAGVFLDTLWVA